MLSSSGIGNHQSPISTSDEEMASSPPSTPPSSSPTDFRDIIVSSNKDFLTTKGMSVPLNSKLDGIIYEVLTHAYPNSLTLEQIQSKLPQGVKIRLIQEAINSISHVLRQGFKVKAVESKQGMYCLQL